MHECVCVYVGVCERAHVFVYVFACPVCVYDFAQAQPPHVSCCINRRRLNIRITELEDSCEQLRVRNGTLEKAKAKLTNEIKEITIELENVSDTHRCHDVSV